MELTAENRARLDRYEKRSAVPMLVLAVAFVLVYGEPILWPDGPSWISSTMELLNLAIWATFLGDFMIRARLSGRFWSYIARHPFDVLLLALPMLRALRVLRVLLAVRFLVSRGRRFAIGRTLAAVAASAVFLCFIAALAVLDAERNAAGATITDFSRALWWVAETVTTVGYGDLSPVTAQGRYIAVAVMVVGIGLVGVVTASIAAWFVSLTKDQDDEVLLELRALRQELAELRGAQ